MPYIPPHRRRQLVQHDSEAAGVSGGVPRRTGTDVAPDTRPLLVLDVNNVLLCRKPYEERSVRGPQCRLRRHCNDFVRFCLEHFQVAVWSCGRRDTLMAELDEIMALRGDARHRLVFVWWQDHSTNLWPRHSAVSEQKPLFLKEITKIWRGDSRFGPANTILIDDHIEKFENNPIGSCMLVPPFVDSDSDDDCLGLGGELVGWLRKLSQAKDTTAMIQASESPFFPAAHTAASKGSLTGLEPQPDEESEPEPELEPELEPDSAREGGEYGI